MESIYYFNKETKNQAIKQQTRKTRGFALFANNDPEVAIGNLEI
jgi:hypothetical protein